MEGVGRQLPSLDVLDDLRSFLPLTEVDQVRPNLVGILVDERQLREEDTCELMNTGPSAPKFTNYSPMNGTHGATMVDSL